MIYDKETKQMYISTNYIILYHWYKIYYTHSIVSNNFLLDYRLKLCHSSDRDYIKQLTTRNSANFLKEFKLFTDSILVFEPTINNPFIERAMEFIASFCYVIKQTFDENDSNTVNEHPFLANIISHILERRNVLNYKIRARSCHLINKILDHLIGTELSIEFCNQIEESMLECLNDPKLEVRLEAILALHRFQEKFNPLDEIINTFKILIVGDRFSKVRRLCLEKIALRGDVMPTILTAIRDVDIGVRLAAFKRLTKLPRALNIEQRRFILMSASHEQSEKIKSFIESSFIPEWLSHFENSIHLFMKAIRLDAREDDVNETNMLCEFILKIIFKLKTLDELLKAVNISATDKLIPLENLNWESCNYWRILIEYIRKHEHFSEEVDHILPELTFFCQYIQRFCDNLPEMNTTTDFLQIQFLLKQLFTITKGYDISDPIGRSTLKNLIRYVLANIVLTLDTVQIIISNLEPIFPSTELRARFINELISDIVSPENDEEFINKEMEYQRKMLALKNDHKEATKLQEVAIAEKNYLLAETLEHRLIKINTEMKQLTMEKQSQLSELPSKKRDIATLIKCLDIAAGFLMSPKVRAMTPSLETLKTETIFELMIHDNEKVQSKALHCYGLCCLIDKKTAQDGIHLFSAPIYGYRSGQECDSQIVLVCIAAIVDLLRIYGTQLVAAPEERTDLSESQREDHCRQFFGGTSLTNIIHGLVDLMNDEEISVQESAGRGLCSLILSNTIQSAHLLSRLVLKWCNAFGESQKLKQMIGVTLQQLAHENSFHKQWENTIFITLKAIVYAPDDSQYCEVNIDEIAKFMVTLYQTNLEDKEDILNFAMRICLEIRKKPKAKQVLVLSNILTMIKFTIDSPLIDDLVAICDELFDVISSASAIKIS
ncbi:hypothetical protein HHI36_019094 [Cryptolaemus montrouzieri]|uniref:Nuclear condensin complex subunit 3 C-terminal domain-containing protein n=1 Tax=Cryptolaemus montrouzieri TaxID=559131 RepID=A0ABD2P1Y7_9CUCU